MRRLAAVLVACPSTGVGKGLDEKYGIDGGVGRKEEKQLDGKRSMEGEKARCHSQRQSTRRGVGRKRRRGWGRLDRGKT
ncbi:hypothetical protein BDW66DRAFT_138187 [Aspergillus desertorum]